MSLTSPRLAPVEYSGLPGAAVFAAVRGLAGAGRLGLSGVKLRGRIAGGDANLFAIRYPDFRMVAGFGDIAEDGHELAAEVRDIADLGTVAGEGYHLKRAFAVGGAEV